ncbi:MAG TPA: hypothetical protein VFL17_07075, partial [Anaerolineae bacterium]|nr:hypothetical protein [Anaerolineae bacterium]
LFSTSIRSQTAALYIYFKLASQDSEVGIAPYYAFPEFKFAGLDPSYNEIAGYAIFFLGRHLAEDRALTNPFAVFRHLGRLKVAAPYHAR